MKIVVITGASRGLGSHLAREFSANGWQVVGTGRSERSADLPKDAAYHRFDAGEAEACEAFWNQISKEYVAAEICLINNAGDYVSGSLTETTSDDYEKQMRSCYFTAVYMTRGLVLSVPKARIINIISSSALAAHKNNSAYGAAKAAEMHFFQSLQHEFKPEAYQITNLYPQNIASWGPDPAATDAGELAAFVRNQAENTGSYYLRDVTIYPRTA